MARAMTQATGHRERQLEGRPVEGAEAGLLCFQGLC